MEESLEIVKNIVKENLKSKFSLDCTLDHARTRRGLQHFLSIKLKNKEAQAFYETLLTYAVQSEKSCPGSGQIFLEMFVGRPNKHFISLKTKNDIVRALTFSVFSKKILDILLYILDVCEENTKINIKKSSNFQTFIEETEGYTFSCRHLLKSNYYSLNFARVACIDGYIENVSQIHVLLSEISDSKNPCLIFCRGMSEDVLYTIKVNNDRQTICVIPFLVPFDIENVNTLVDIAVVSGTDILSSNKGEIISSLCLQKTGKIDHVRIQNDEIVIKNFHTRQRIREHSDFIKKTIEERSDIEDVLSKRLRSLNASCIDVCIPDDINFFSDSQQLDEGIRLVMSCIKNTYNPVMTADFFMKKYKIVLDSSVLYLL